MNAGAFLALLFFEYKTVLLTNLRSNVRLNRLSLIRKHIKLHQILNDLEGLHLHHFCQVFDDDGWLNMNDLLNTDLLNAFFTFSSFSGIRRFGLALAFFLFLLPEVQRLSLPFVERLVARVSVILIIVCGHKSSGDKKQSS